MDFRILRTATGPFEFELRINHCIDSKRYYAYEYLNSRNYPFLEHIKNHCEQKLIHFILEDIYQTHGQGD